MGAFTLEFVVQIQSIWRQSLVHLVGVKAVFRTRVHTPANHTHQLEKGLGFGSCEFWYIRDVSEAKYLFGKCQNE